ncbi:hypothetical protein O181_002303 [Austropuccinia psidii MF-1]|uniref:MMS19 nucleotide excision repair protein n=1 Tax=Austropuccinia psidii MF-1 TaxID=1389203 RepID=A0A9Q3BC82_9BASI|nr:hypothetical protein [Austropuccinia psidii MF-1]
MSSKIQSQQVTTCPIYLFPNFNDLIQAFSLIELKWDPNCLKSIDIIDIYLHSLDSSQPIHIWKTIQTSNANLTTQFLPDWWNNSQSVSLQLIITPSDQPVWAGLGPGPIFKAQFNGTTPTNLISNPSKSSKITHLGSLTIEFINDLYHHKSNSLSGPKLVMTIFMPIFSLIIAISIYVFISRRRSGQASKRWSQFVDQRMSILGNQSWTSIHHPNLNSRPNSSNLQNSSNNRLTSIIRHSTSLPPSRHSISNSQNIRFSNHSHSTSISNHHPSSLRFSNQFHSQSTNLNQPPISTSFSSNSNLNSNSNFIPGHHHQSSWNKSSSSLRFELQSTKKSKDHSNSPLSNQIIQSKPLSSSISKSNHPNSVISPDEALLQYSLSRKKKDQSPKINFLVNFFCDKLTDQPIIILEALNGLIFLSNSIEFTSQNAISCCQSLFDHIESQDFNQAGRLLILMLIDNLLAHHLNGLKSMGSDFITGYCKLVQGEKDPRNLIVAFKLDKVILTQFELADKVEDMFDITFCYFPINFKPAGYGLVTSQELMDGLIDCLSATHRFGILALPLLLDKFQAPGWDPKVQVLETVVKAFPIYGQSVVTEFALLFWESFLLEIFQPNLTPDKKVLGLLQRACQTLLRIVFPPGLNTTSSTTLDFKKRILDVTQKELHSPEKSKAVSATRLLGWIIESGADVDHIIFPTIHSNLTALLRLWKETGVGQDAHQRRLSILQHLDSIFSSMSTFARSKDDLLNDSPQAWLPSTIRDELLNIMLTGMLEDNQGVHGTRATTMRTLVKFIGIPNMLSLQEAKNVITVITQVFLSIDDEDLNNAAIESLSRLTDIYPNDVASITLPKLFHQLSTTDLLNLKHQPLQYIKILEGLTTLCDRTTLFKPFVFELLSRLDLGPHTSPRTILSHTHTKVDSFNYHAYCHHLLLSLYAVVHSKIQPTGQSSPDKTVYLQGRAEVRNHTSWIISRLFEILLCQDTTSSSVPISPSSEKDLKVYTRNELSTTVLRSPDSICNDVRLIMDVGRIVNLLVGNLDVEEQQEFVNKLHAGYNLGSIEELIGKVPNYSGTEIPFEPMSMVAPESHQNTVIIYSEGMIAIRPEINFPHEILSIRESFPFKCYYHSLKTGVFLNPVLIQAGLRWLCSTVNRRACDFSEFFDEQLNQFWESEIRPGSLTDHRLRFLALDIWIWVIKGLIVRSDNRAYKLLDRVCKLLREETKFGRWVGHRLCIIVEEEDETLSSQNHGIVKFLWKQRAFHYLVGQFIEGYNLSSGSNTVYLVGLTSLLARVPPSVVSLELERVMPLLLESLILPDANVKLNALKTIYQSIMDGNSEGVFQHNLLSLISALLLNCTFGNPLRHGNVEDDDEHGNVSNDKPKSSQHSHKVRMLTLKVLTTLPTKFGSDSTLSIDECLQLIKLSEVQLNALFQIKDVFPGIELEFAKNHVAYLAGPEPSNHNTVKYLTSLDSPIDFNIQPKNIPPSSPDPTCPSFLFQNPQMSDQDLTAISRFLCNIEAPPMANQQHLNLLLFVSNFLTNTDTSAPSSETLLPSYSDSNLKAAPTHLGSDSGIYHDQSSEEYKGDENGYLIAEDSGPGVDEVTPPKHCKTAVKRQHIQLF